MKKILIFTIAAPLTVAVLIVLLSLLFPEAIINRSPWVAPIVKIAMYHRGLEIKAAEKIYSFGDSVIPTLQKLLKEENDRAKIVALGTLVKFDKEYVFNDVISILDDKSVAIRRAALDYIARSSKDADFTKFAILASDSDATVRRKLIETLAVKQPGLNLDLFFNMLNDSDDGVRFTAFATLLKFKSPKLSDELLLHKLDDPDSGIRAYAIRELGERKSNQSTDKLIGSLKDPSPFVRIEAAKSLGKIRNPKSLIHLEELSRSNLNKDERKIVSDALSQISSTVPE